MNTDTLEIYEGALRQDSDVPLTAEQAKMLEGQKRILGLVREAVPAYQPQSLMEHLDDLRRKRDAAYSLATDKHQT